MNKERLDKWKAFKKHGIGNDEFIMQDIINSIESYAYLNDIYFNKALKIIKEEYDKIQCN